MTDLSHDLRISREALEAAEKRASHAEQRATAAEEKLERELRAVRQVFGEKESLGRQVAALELKRAEAERAVAALKAAALVVTTDAAQDVLEDPIGSGERLASGFRRIHVTAMRHLNETLAASPIGSGWLSPEQGAEKDARIAEMEKALAALGIPDDETLDAVDDDALSGKRPFPITITIAKARAVNRALAAHPTEQEAK